MSSVLDFKSDLLRLNGATTDILVKLLLKQMNQKDFFPNKKTKGNFVLTAQYCFKNGPQTDHLVKTFSANL